MRSKACLTWEGAPPKNAMPLAQELCQPDAQACAEKVPANGKWRKLHITLLMNGVAHDAEIMQHAMDFQRGQSVMGIELNAEPTMSQ